MSILYALINIAHAVICYWVAWVTVRSRQFLNKSEAEYNVPLLIFTCWKNSQLPMWKCVFPKWRCTFSLISCATFCFHMWKIIFHLNDQHYTFMSYMYFHVYYIISKVARIGNMCIFSLCRTGSSKSEVFPGDWNNGHMHQLCERGCTASRLRDVWDCAAEGKLRVLCSSVPASRPVA